jgi:multifunctional methyltransferase subunit TRM112
MVRLITHNLLACHAKGCTSNNFPLVFNDAQVEIREAEFNEDFLRGFMPKIEWDALVNAAREVLNTNQTHCLFSDNVRQLGDVSLPETPPEKGAESEEFYKILHHVLMEVNNLFSV